MNCPDPDKCLTHRGDKYFRALLHIQSLDNVRTLLLYKAEVQRIVAAALGTKGAGDGAKVTAAQHEHHYVFLRSEDKKLYYGQGRVREVEHWDTFFCESCLSYERVKSGVTKWH